MCLKHNNINEKEEAHGTPERCSPAEYHNKKSDVDCADRFRLFKGTGPG